MECCHQSIGTHDDRTIREIVVVLFDVLQILSGIICLADRTRSQVQDMIAIVGDICVELGHASVGPIFTSHRKDVSQSIRFGDGAVDIRDDHLIVVIPQEQLC